MLAPRRAPRLTAEQSEDVIQHLMVGKPRQEIVDKYNLSKSKLTAYITKANKRKKLSPR